MELSESDVNLIITCHIKYCEKYCFKHTFIQIMLEHSVHTKTSNIDLNSN